MRIHTQVKPTAVVIERQQYPLAPRTIALLEKLRAVEKKAAETGRMRHQVQLEQLACLLGEQAVRALFPAGEEENADRLEAIYFGVLGAFDRESRARRAARAGALAMEARSLTEALRPLAELAALLRDEAEGGPVLIRRPEEEK